MSDDYECLTCGACCVSDDGDSSYVRVSDEDYERLRKHEKANLVITEVEWMKFRSLRCGIDVEGNTRCSCLGGAIGVKVSCLIYERRPSACRKFEVGNMACLEARKRVFGSDR